MPILRTEQAQAGVDTTPGGGTGVIVYDWDPRSGALLGRFVLGMYEGALAIERGRKNGGDPGVLAGVYSIETYAPQGALFATGQLTLAPVGESGAYGVTYDLLPTPESLQALGYVAGTRLLYQAIGYKLPDRDQLVAGWDNDAYTRVFGNPPQKEWGYRFIQGS